MRMMRCPFPGLPALQVECAADIANADKLIFPGVGAFGQAMTILEQRGYTQVRCWARTGAEQGGGMGGGTAIQLPRGAGHAWPATW